MNNLDFLIPEHIIKLAELDKFDLQITLSASPARGNWPKVKISVNETCISDGEVNQIGVFSFTDKIVNSGDKIKIIIERYGKTDRDVVTSQNTIIENQSVDITKFLVNGVDIVQTELIYKFGKQYRLLSDSQKKYFEINGIDTGPTYSLTLADNGYWEIFLNTPILTGFAEAISIREKQSGSIDYNLYNEIYNTVLNVRQLEQRLK